MSAAEVWLAFALGTAITGLALALLAAHTPDMLALRHARIEGQTLRGRQWHGNILPGLRRQPCYLHTMDRVSFRPVAAPHTRAGPCPATPLAGLGLGTLQARPTPPPLAALARMGRPLLPAAQNTGQPGPDPHS